MNISSKQKLLFTCTLASLTTPSQVLSTKLLAKRSNLKLKSVTIIHSATTETVRLPDDNNGVIVHTAVRTKVPFKKKVRGERKMVKTSAKTTNNNNNNNNNNSKKLIKTVKSTTHGNLRGSKVISSEAKKSSRSKKNRISGAAAAATIAQSSTLAALGTEKPSGFSGEQKKVKKLRKHSKEIIDYSARNGQSSSGAGGGAHTNTFGKVQKWLLESPIVAQPLSHIEHSSKVRKVMSKSQSTPERLVPAKSPQKTKSLGNLANEKVKLQVVYKPPFRFALRLSKNAKVKTHAVGNGSGGAVGKVKRQTRAEAKRYSAGAVDGGVEKTKRPALLIRGSNEEDNQILTLSEPNYETLTPKTAPTKLENPFYENLNFSGNAANESNQRISRSWSKTNLEASSSKSQRTPSYTRSNSLSNNNPFTVSGAQRNSRKLSETHSSATNTNFGSTQNLIQQSNHLAKSKKRSSLNLKSSLAKNGKDPPNHGAKRSSSNMNLRRNSSGNNLLPVNLTTQPALPPSEAPPHEQLLRRNSAQSTQLPTQRTSRASFSNIPRANLSTSAGNNSPASNSNSLSNFSFSRQSSGSAANSSRNEQRRSRSNLPQMLTPNASTSSCSSSSSSANGTATSSAHSRSNSLRQQLPQNYHAPPPLQPTAAVPTERERELPSELEVMISDVENLVS